MYERELRVEVHWEDGSYWAEVSELPGCLASGATLDELITAVWDAIRLCITPADARTLASIRLLVESVGLRVESDREVEAVPSAPGMSYGTVPRSRDPHRRREAAVAWQRRGNRFGHGSRLTEWTAADVTDVQKQAAAAYGRMIDAEQELYALWERAGLNLEDCMRLRMPAPRPRMRSCGSAILGGRPPRWAAASSWWPCSPAGR